MSMPDWLRARLEYCQPETRRAGTWCRAGGWMNFAAIGLLGAPEPNYGYPHVLGTIYWEDGSTSTATRCIFCGHQPEKGLTSTA